MVEPQILFVKGGKEERQEERGKKGWREGDIRAIYMNFSTLEGEEMVRQSIVKKKHPGK